MSCANVLTPVEASNYFPDPCHRVTNDESVFVPEVDCGDGYRQLLWLEEIQIGDEYFGGTDEVPKWLPVTLGLGARYRPHTANSFYAPWSIIRRKTNAE